MTTFHILDTETASLTGGVCEIAWLKVDEKLSILEEFSSYVNPERPIEDGAFKVHGISQNMVENAPTMSMIGERLPDPINIIAHNAAFDIRMIHPHIQIDSKICSLALARKYLKGVPNHKLQTLVQHLGLSQSTSHAALADVHSVRDLLARIMAVCEQDLTTLMVRESRPKVLHRFPFGKYKDYMVWDIPASYTNWLLKQTDLPKDVKYTLQLLQKGK